MSTQLKSFGDAARPHAARNRWEKPLLYLVLTLLSVATLFCLIWMFYTSFKSNAEITMNIFALPTQLHFENYVNAWQTAKIGVYLFNSVYVATVAIVLTVLVSAMAAFILSKFTFRLQRLVYTMFIIGMLIPLQSVLVPLFIQMRNLNLLNTHWSLIFSYTAFGLPISVFILESFMRSFPDAIIEAAVMDGCSIPRVFFQMILPMSRPAIATVTILNFLNNWKEFSFALIFINDDIKKTLPLGLYNFLGAYSSNYAELMAALTISSIPIILLYLILQEQVINGMTSGAVKG
ncbi:carbohydrate ABC transporter membrane protein 2 (CUT1 family) [Hydrogenispora ethanolica]|uniref:Carbohydrate ABC transporter membrane protein 2 (CUT1 family) n=1 Tax=Hydrogenispora ethanolica TaxID=1082276 RepID=A0A4R1R8F6_HYDET|nr:carbohydrate ABC transporter permease [Hydrogenispora ethanolica]TCL61941.1 carbohydrate ABC transporter membrane protein 2 (CUT1 family) [Hydrogenispora ethanolica]